MQEIKINFLYLRKDQANNSKMKVLIEIADREAEFGIKVLKSLSFVKNARPMSADSVELWEALNDAAEEVKLHKQGKLKLRTAEELLNEL